MATACKCSTSPAFAIVSLLSHFATSRKILISFSIRGSYSASVCYFKKLLVRSLVCYLVRFLVCDQGECRSWSSGFEPEALGLGLGTGQSAGSGHSPPEKTCACAVMRSLKLDACYEDFVLLPVLVMMMS